MHKVDVVITGLQGCFGCLVSLIHLWGGNRDLLGQVEIKYSPIQDAKVMPHAKIGIIEGAIGDIDQEETLKEMREKTDILVALGTCATFGGIAGMRNLFHLQDVLDRSYVESESTQAGKMPGPSSLPQMLDCIKPLSAVVEVDQSIPGCPPSDALLKTIMEALQKGEKAAVPTKNLCIECGRKREDILIPKQQFLSDSIYAPLELQELAGSTFLLPRRTAHDIIYSLFELEEIDENKCFLEQAVLCLGPATAEGCGARCLHANIPCRGCSGPVPNISEQGTKMINALAAILPSGALMFMEDIMGTGYRYSLPISMRPCLVKERKDR
jgi:F420-non-reducing hydrogenase small subunit